MLLALCGVDKKNLVDCLDMDFFFSNLLKIWREEVYFLKLKSFESFEKLKSNHILVERVIK